MVWEWWLKSEITEMRKLPPHFTQTQRETMVYGPVKPVKAKTQLIINSQSLPGNVHILTDVRARLMFRAYRREEPGIWLEE